jgi:hypothetical protein
MEQKMRKIRWKFTIWDLGFTSGIYDWKLQLQNYD